ncbi:unnamed protein product [Paramecium octaurelia]|uniref:Uncharacterized protein n=1 Tax=Paramecium octaurelia TaxID=43137 RepID=A0A8S1UHS6_PAROT|nr:unnamed protein product [Paramecium octaurelia]
MIIFIFLIYITRQTQIEIYQFNASSNFSDEWVGGYFRNCGDVEYFGPSISRIFLNLESHSHIIVDAYLLSDYSSMTDFWIDESTQPYYLSYSQKYCGSTLIYFYNISRTLQHKRRTVLMEFYLHHGGLISLKLSIIKCQYECAGCIENYHATYQQWKLHQYSLNDKLSQNLDGWTFVSNNSQYQMFGCGGCQFQQFLELNYSTELPPHQDVLIRFFKIDRNTLIVNYLYGKKVINYHYLIEILIRNHQDPILSLNFKIPGSYPGQIRDFELFYTEPLIKVPTLNEGCLEQIDEKCLICQEGWIQAEFFENCHPICGNGIIEGQEECDDHNLTSNHTCFQCKYQCVQFCQICQFGICLQCIDGFTLVGFTCDPVCGDVNLTPYSVEQCELAVNGVWDGCKDCRFIQIADCKTHYFSICLECDIGFQMIENVCYPNCGDKIILEQYEDCDDGNLQPYDGCYQCKFQCIEDCNICNRGQCILKCSEGYQFINDSCHSVCGDQMVTKEEDCDDGNSIQFDGCFQCKYSCPENCIDCYKGNCLECNYQYELLISNECKLQLKCGDGLLYEQEECDDGNYEAADGCYDCLIEQNWICITITRDSPSQCTFVQAPNLGINYLNMTQNKQYISLQFNQQVQIYTSQPLSETIYFELLEIDKKHWNSSLFIIQDVESYLSFGEYVIQIEVNQLLDFRPVLKIGVNQTVANIMGVVLVDSEKYIKLEYPKYLDETQKQYSQSLKIYLGLLQQVFYQEVEIYLLKFWRSFNFSSTQDISIYYSLKIQRFIFLLMI